jgi:hypothetical protein
VGSAEPADCWHELLGRPDLVQASAERLDSELRRRGLFFGERPLCTVLRPRFVTTAQYRTLRRRATLVLRALNKSHQRAMADTGFRAQFGLEPWEQALLAQDPGFPEPSPMGRLDAFFAGADDGLRFTEYNAETPAGAAYGDALAEVFLALPVTGVFLRRFQLRPLPVLHQVLHALLRAHGRWSGGRRQPRIAIVDWRDVPTVSEFRLTAEYLARHGLEAVIVDPRELDYRAGTLRGPAGAVDLVYKRVLINELVARGGLEQPLIRAVREGAVCMVNPFRCKILHKKASFAVLSDELNADMFDAAERNAIAAHVPWTRVVADRRTRVADREVDLLEYAEANRSKLVLKPNDEYGGKGIVLGWEVEDGEWRQALRAALHEPFVVQQRIPLPTELFPLAGDGAPVFEERIVDTAPFVFGGSGVDGCLTRVSTASLVNVTAGGGSSLATFIVERR